MGWRIRVIDSCEIPSNRKSIEVTPTKRPGGGDPTQPEAEDSEYEYYDDDTSETTSAQPVAGVNDDGFLVDAPFHSKFPLDFSSFFSSGQNQDDEEAHPVDVDHQQPEGQDEDIRPVTSRIFPRPEPNSLLPHPPVKVNQQLDDETSDRNRQNHRPEAAVEASNRNRPKLRPNTVESANWNHQNHRPGQVEPPHRNRQSHRPDQTQLLERPPQLQFGFQDGFKSVQSQITVGQTQQSQPDSSGMKPGRVIPVHNRNQPAVSSSSGSFDPSTIILESGFRPIRKSNGPVPPLGFEVEASSNEKKNPALADSNFVTNLDPIFVPSDLEKNRYSDPVPVPLPEAIVPVIPGPPQITFRPFQQPSLRPIQQRRPVPVLPTPPPPPQRKSSLLSFLNFGSQRRQSTPGHLPPR